MNTSILLPRPDSLAEHEIGRAAQAGGGRATARIVLEQVERRGDVLVLSGNIRELKVTANGQTRPVHLSSPATPSPLPRPTGIERRQSGG